jgi:hypothetical protein
LRIVGHLLGSPVPAGRNRLLPSAKKRPENGK